MNFDSLHLGQSTQPNPDPVSLTKAPVKMITQSDPNAIPVTRRKVLVEITTPVTVSGSASVHHFFVEPRKWLRSHT